MIVLNIVLGLHTAVAVTSTVLNTLLMIVMTRYTPESFRSYSLLLKMHASFDIIISVCSLSTMLRAVPCGWSTVYISYGPCSLLSDDLCYYLYSIFLASNVVTFATVLVSIGARYWILRFGHITKKRIMTAQMGAFLPALVVLTAFFSSKANFVDLRSVLEEYHPEYEDDDLVIIGTIPARTPAKLAIITFVMGCPIPLFLVIWIYRSLILRLLNQQSKAMSVQTKHVHRQFVTILTIQAALPFFVLLGIGIYVFGVFEIAHNPPLEVATFIMVELPALISPIIVVIHIRSYYEAVTNLLHWRIKKPLSTIMFPNHILEIPMTTRRPATPISPMADLGPLPCNRRASVFHNKNKLGIPMTKRRPSTPISPFHLHL